MAKSFLTLFFLFLVFSVSLVSFAGYTGYKAYDFQSHAASVQGEIVDTYTSIGVCGSRRIHYNCEQTMYKIKYIVDGNAYFNSNRLSNVKHVFGDKIELLYHKKHPEISYIPSEIWDKAKIFTVSAVPFFIPAIALSAFCAYLYLWANRKNWLQQYGMPIAADITKVYRPEQMEKFGTNSYIAEAEWNNGDKMYNFKAFIDPSLANNIKKLPFLIDPKNPGRYVLDTDRMNGLMKF